MYLTFIILYFFQIGLRRVVYGESPFGGKDDDLLMVSDSIENYFNIITMYEKENDVTSSKFVTKRNLGTPLTSWINVNSYAPWTSRSDFAFSVVGTTIYIFGGTGASYKNDIWKSSDFGASWTQVAATSSWSSRKAFSSVAIGSDIFILGGVNGIYIYLYVCIIL